jgi:hypothetical protein
MKHVIIVILLFLLGLSCVGQTVELSDDKRIEVRNDDGDLIASNYFAGAVGAVAANKTIAIWYDNDRVEVRDQNLSLISSNYFVGVTGLAITTRTQNASNSKDRKTVIVIYYKDRRVEMRGTQLNFISSRYR